jgi:dipeptide transport system substrate-binding protein
MAVVASTVAALALGASAQAKNLVYCSEGSPEGFNPSLYTAGTTFDASSRPVFNRLVEFERGTTKIVPALAESWEVSDDGLAYTFNLRKGAKFHTTADFTPSRDFNADDVVYSFERQLKADHPYHKVSGGAYEYFNGMGMPDLLKSIEKVDDHTVKFTLTKPEAPMIANLGMDFASVLSAEYADQMMAAGTPEKVDLNPVGTGPFQLVAYQKDAVIRYKAHPDYWGGKAAIDNLIYAITPDPSVRYQKLKAGECHVMPYPNPADIEAMQADPDINLMEQEGLNVGYLAFNTEKEPFTDRRVRQALNMAINKQAIIDVVFQGAGKAAKNPIPPTIWSYNEATQDYAYDPANLGHARAAALQPQRPAHGRADPGRLGQGRGRGRDRHLRVGRVPEALQGGRARDHPARLDRRQRRPGQLPLRAARLRCGLGRQPGALVPQALRRPAA